MWQWLSRNMRASIAQCYLCSSDLGEQMNHIVKDERTDYIDNVDKRAFQICSYCEQRLPYLEHYCQGCGIVLCIGEHNRLCGKCQKKGTSLDDVIAAFTYEWPMHYLIHQFKFNHRMGLAKTLAQLLVQHWQEKSLGYELDGQERPTLPDMFIAIPLHKKRYHYRGYNQSAELAKHLSKSLAVDVDNDVLRRVLYTTPQSELTFKQRKQSVRGCFACADRAQIVDLHIGLVDDVMTSGETLYEAARILKKRGAKQVSAWVLARTMI